jgi:hypothetical protein
LLTETMSSTTSHGSMVEDTGWPFTFALRPE